MFFIGGNTVSNKNIDISIQGRRKKKLYYAAIVYLIVLMVQLELFGNGEAAIGTVFKLILIALFTVGIFWANRTFESTLAILSGLLCLFYVFSRPLHPKGQKHIILKTHTFDESQLIEHYGHASIIIKGKEHASHIEPRGSLSLTPGLNIGDTILIRTYLNPFFIDTNTIQIRQPVAEYTVMESDTIFVDIEIVQVLQDWIHHATLTISISRWKLSVWLSLALYTKKTLMQTEPH